MDQYFRDNPSREQGLNQAIRRYFEVTFCDEMDLFIYLFGFSKRFSREVKIEGKENLEEALKAGEAFSFPLILGADFGSFRF